MASVVGAKERCGSPTSRDPLPANRHQQWTHCSTNEIPVVAMEGSQLEWTDTAIMGMSGIKNGGLSHHCTLEVSIRSTACLTTSVRRSVKYQLQWRGYLEQRMQYRRIPYAYCLLTGEGYEKVSLCHAVRRKPVNLSMYN